MRYLTRRGAAGAAVLAAALAPPAGAAAALAAPGAALAPPAAALAPPAGAAAHSPFCPPGATDRRYCAAAPIRSVTLPSEVTVGKAFTITIRLRERADLKVELLHNGAVDSTFKANGATGSVDARFQAPAQPIAYKVRIAATVSAGTQVVNSQLKVVQHAHPHRITLHF
jgi:hypothetical protein